MVPLVNSIPCRYATPSPEFSLRRTPFLAPSLRLLTLRLKTFKPLPSASPARSGSIIFCLPPTLEAGESSAAQASAAITRTRLFIAFLRFLLVVGEPLSTGGHDGHGCGPLGIAEHLPS